MQNYSVAWLIQQDRNSPICLSLPSLAVVLHLVHTSNHSEVRAAAQPDSPAGAVH